MKPQPLMTRERLLRAYWMETRMAALVLMRTPRFAFITIGLPVMFYLLFGVAMRPGGGNVSTYVLAGYTVFGLTGLGLFAFGASYAVERDSGVLKLKRAQPLPAGAYFAARLITAMAFAAAISIGLSLLAVLAAHVPLTPAQALSLLLTSMLGVLPMCALGLLLATFVSGNAAQGAVNMVYIPMSFLSGLWFPLNEMPPIFGQIAPIWPSFHVQRLALESLSLASDEAWPHILALIAFTAGFLRLAQRRLHKSMTGR